MTEAKLWSCVVKIQMRNLPNEALIGGFLAPFIPFKKQTCSPSELNFIAHHFRLPRPFQCPLLPFSRVYRNASMLPAHFRPSSLASKTLSEPSKYLTKLLIHRPKGRDIKIVVICLDAACLLGSIFFCRQCQ